MVMLVFVFYFVSVSCVKLIITYSEIILPEWFTISQYKKNLFLRQNSFFELGWVLSHSGSTSKDTSFGWGVGIILLNMSS